MDAAGAALEYFRCLEKGQLVAVLRGTTSLGMVPSMPFRKEEGNVRFHFLGIAPLSKSRL